MPQNVLRRVGFITVLAVLTIAASAPVASAEDRPTVVTIETPLGTFQIELFPDSAPLTVANFLRYINDGDFEDSFFHRSVPGFVIQGGGFVFDDGLPVAIVTNPPVPNEFNRSNVRGTISMAKQAGNPNSATSQWFINLADNSAALDEQNGGFTVFGQVLGGGMAVVDALAAVPVFNAGGTFGELPLRDYTVGNSIQEENLLFTQMSAGSPPPPPLLLRRSTNRSWSSYRLSSEDGVVTIEEKGGVKLTRSRDFETASRQDFNGDGEPDVLLRDTSTTARASGWSLATLDGKKVTSNDGVELLTGDDWTLVTTADFDGDGKADALFRNGSDGTWMLQLLDGQTVRTTQALDLSDELTDTVAGTGDFDDDGRTDLLLRRKNGTWLMYLIKGVGTPTSGRPKLPKSPRSSLAAIADFDGDGSDDVLMRDDRGRWQYFAFEGTKVATKGSVPMSRDLGFTVASNADFNGDGMADVLLRNADGTWHLYALDGRKVVLDGPLEMSDDLGYSLIMAPDFNGDGNADALLRHTDGDWLLYELDGSTPTVLNVAVPKLPKSPTWVPQLD